MAAGVTMPTASIEAFRRSVNAFYTESGLKIAEQQQGLLPKNDTDARFSEITEQLVVQIDSLEPFGNGNERPIIKTENVLVKSVRRMGSDGQHVKLTVSDGTKEMDCLAFNAEESWFVEPGKKVNIWYQPDVNEWRGRRSVEGRLLNLEAAA